MTSNDSVVKVMVRMKSTKQPKAGKTHMSFGDYKINHNWCEVEVSEKLIKSEHAEVWLDIKPTEDTGPSDNVTPLKTEDESESKEE